MSAVDDPEPGNAPATPSAPHPLAATLRRVERASAALATRSVARMDETLPWFRSLPADQRSWVTLVAQAGIGAFVDWLRHPGGTGQVIGDVFGAAPPELARSVSLQRTVSLVRVMIEVVESQTDTLAAPGEEIELREAVLRFGQEVAFAAAAVYARAAETRGAWDARLQALLVDALVRGDSPEGLASRAAALGWDSVTPVHVVVGTPPEGTTEAVLDSLARAGRHAGADVLAGVQGEWLVVVLGRTRDALGVTRALLGEFGPGPVVVGPGAGTLADAVGSAHAALSGALAATGWPNAPRPVDAADLIAERALAGDRLARETLYRSIYLPLREAGSPLLDTVASYLDGGRSLEATARALFVHPNTVRYRLRRVADICGRSPTVARDAFILQLALVVGRLDADQRRSPAHPGGSL